MSEANEIDDDEIGIWNYRIVNVKSKNGGKDWYCLQEVHYRGGKPMGYGEPCLGSETMETFMFVWQMLEQALKEPPLQEEDFKKGEAK
ncbi:MAG: hypothetical protein ACO3SE_07885 [Sedimenticolaceae bacterium]